MPRYFMHVVEGDRTYRDTEGSEAPDLQTAEKLAQNAGRELLSEALKHKTGDCSTILRVEDEEQRKLFEISVSCSLSTSWLV